MSDHTLSGIVAQMKAGDTVDTRWQAGIDVSDATELLLFASLDCAAPPDFEVTASADPDDGTIIVATVEPPDSDDVGRYYVEIQATFPDDQVITFPAKGYGTLIISPDLGPASS